MQTVKLIGVVDDGSIFGSGVPENTARTIQLPLMSSITLEVAIVYSSGVPVDLSALSVGWAGYFTVVQHPCSCEQMQGRYDYQLSSTTIKSETRNVLVFSIPSTALRKLIAGRWFYDISISGTGFKWQVIRISGLHLEAALRRA